ncbi:class I SAM-dependent methyltransferase [Robertmurraya yapensis]|uniref:Class I SAM-dependent methyltransferase n=2 Tax=Bacillaceae TaxID=186817 RepID=A0A3S0I8R8_9BACI|nr:class I SAM-dependent methyltransferase [Bacillus yapensis]RTR27844.1 class I SAM-dependent methyltransferase [Bacillus yapensis]TKS94247.1 class I SAM-dependent methyltransferase [Bacillus yapensis]
MDNIKNKVISQFGKHAEKYVTSEIHAKGTDLHTLVEWLQPQKAELVLDIATGGGHVAKALSPHVSHVFATDLTRDMLANTARHLKKVSDNVSYIITDAENLPFLDESFDIVTCRIAAHHFPNPQDFIKEVARVLKSNGSFLLIDNVSPKEEHLAQFMNTLEALRDESHSRCLSVEEWQELFSKSNLKEVQSQLRKKTYTFPSWVERTANSQEQINRVNQYIFDANEAIQKYFNISCENAEIQSMQIDEWMVMCKKED